jgi:hypothetical protein
VREEGRPERRTGAEGNGGEEEEEEEEEEELQR